MHRKLLIVLAVVCAVAIPTALVACGGDDETTTSATTTSSTTTDETATTADGAGGGGETVDISETEYAIDPADVTTRSGEVRFAVTNDGNTAHNLEIEGNGVEATSETIEGGASTDLSVDLQPGTYEMYCGIANHRDLGMEGEVTVD